MRFKAWPRGGNAYAVYYRKRQRVVAGRFPDGSELASLSDADSVHVPTYAEPSIDGRKFAGFFAIPGRKGIVALYGCDVVHVSQPDAGTIESAAVSRSER